MGDKCINIESYKLLMDWHCVRKKVSLREGNAWKGVVFCVSVVCLMCFLARSIVSRTPEK